jgi:hypothetical protein
MNTERIQNFQYGILEASISSDPQDSLSRDVE